MNNDIAIKVENLSKVYKLYTKPIDRMREALSISGTKYHKDYYALNDVSFEIKKGECVGIIGKNGAGKSTLLKILTGVLNPTSGKVNVNGRISALLELGAGFNPEYTGLENIYFQGNLMGFTDEEMDSRVKQIEDFADIGEFIYQPVKTYSSGMFARLAFAVAINVEPDILIVDEALSVGDIAFQAKCFNKFKEFKNKGITILFVTHAIDLIIKNCDSAIMIDLGVIVSIGDCKKVVELFRKNITSYDVGSVGMQDVGNTYNLKKQLQLNNNPNIYGSFDAEIIDFGVINDKGIITNQLYHDAVYIIQISVKFNKDIIDPIIAYTIRSVDGLELTGTNTMNLNTTFEKVKANSVITVRFEQKMILNSGVYLLALGCTKFDNGGLIINHRIYDALSIEVISTNIATGLAFSISDCSFIS